MNIQSVMSIHFLFNFIFIPIFDKYKLIEAFLQLASDSSKGIDF